MIKRYPLPLHLGRRYPATVSFLFKKAAVIAPIIENEPKTDTVAPFNKRLMPPNELKNGQAIQDLKKIVRSMAENESKSR